MILDKDKERLALLRNSRFPPGGENYWLDVERLVKKEALEFTKEHEELIFRKHSHAPRWFLVEKEANKERTKRIQITLRGEPGRFILSLIPGATLHREKGLYALSAVDPGQYVQVVRLKGGLDWQTIEVMDKLGEALKKALEDAEHLAKLGEEQFSIRLR